MNATLTNNTFRGAEPTWANACVGDNGAPGIVDYAEGFAAAANALLRICVVDRGVDPPIDALIYPICFSMRHAIELSLKATAEDLRELARIQGKTPPEFNLVASHDLGLLWEYVTGLAKDCDDRLAVVMAALNEYVTDVAALDSTGQVFRYPFDIENHKQLVKTPVINVLVLQRRFNEVEELLKRTLRMTSSLIEEYGLGTFTAHLSRQQIFKIAGQLPPKAQWADAEFDDVRNLLKAKYKLSSNELGRALNFIKRRHEMAALIGMCVAIPGMSTEVLGKFFDTWSELHDMSDVVAPPPARIADAAEMRAALIWDVKRQQAGKALAKVIAPEALAAIKSLFYFSQELPASEAFDELLKNYGQEAERHKADQRVFGLACGRMLGKPLAVEHVLNSLNFLGQNEAVEFVIERYGLGHARERLLERSERRKAIAMKGRAS